MTVGAPVGLAKRTLCLAPIMLCAAASSCVSEGVDARGGGSLSHDVGSGGAAGAGGSLGGGGGTSGLEGGAAGQAGGSNQGGASAQGGAAGQAGQGGAATGSGGEGGGAGQGGALARDGSTEDAARREASLEAMDVARALDASRDVARSGPLRIMPLGDSTTGSVCWRAQLWQLLNESGFAGRFDLVGSRRNDPGCGVLGYDQDNEGHPTVLVTNFVVDADDQVADIQTPELLLSRSPADIVLFHFATNDIWNGIAPGTILGAYSTVLAALRRANPNVVVLVAQLIPMVVTTGTCQGCTACPECPGRVTAFNGVVPGWASANSTVASPIRVIDQWTGFNATMNIDTVDGVHPNDSGSRKIAQRWYSALLPWF